MRKATGGGGVYLGHDTNLKVDGILLQSPTSMLGGGTHRNIGGGGKKESNTKWKKKFKIKKGKRDPLNLASYVGPREGDLPWPHLLWKKILPQTLKKDMHHACYYVLNAL